MKDRFGGRMFKKFFSGCKRIFSRGMVGSTQIVEVEGSESIYEYARRLAKFAKRHHCQVKGNYNEVDLYAGPNTHPQYLVGYFHGLGSK